MPTNIGYLSKPNELSNYYRTTLWKVNTLQSFTVGITDKSQIKLDSLITNKYDYYDYKNFKIKIRKELKHILESFKESEKILSLKEGWDDNDGKPISFQTWVKAINFVNDYSHWILDHFDIILSEPLIQPGPDASVDLVWRNDNYRFLINIPEDNNSQGDYYGDNKKDGNSINGKIPFDTVIEFVAAWMKNLKF